MLATVLSQVAQVDRPVHEIGLPQEIVKLWRIAYWVGCVLVGGRLLQDAIRRGALLSTRLMRWALIVFFMWAAVTHAQAWEYPAVWEGLPVHTVILAFAAASLRRYHSEEETSIRDAAGMGPRW
jgi:hypothetical protein